MNGPSNPTRGSDSGNFWRSPVLFITAALALAAAIVLGLMLTRPYFRPPAPPATAPVAPTPPAIVSRPPPITNWTDIVSRAMPALAATRPLKIGLDLREAARIKIDAPIYLDAVHDLWVTDPNADPLVTVLARAADESVHVVTERVLFVHYAVDESGFARPHPVFTEGDGSPVMWTGKPHKALAPLPQNIRWDLAIDWPAADAIAAPVAGGAVVFQFSPDVPDLKFSYTDIAGPTTQPRSTDDPVPDIGHCVLLLDSRGLLAWIPADPQHNIRGSAVSRFVDSSWKPLDPKDGWDPPILQLSPFRDGTVQRLKLDPQGNLVVDRAALDFSPADPAVIERLVDDLSDPDADRRDRAFSELSSYRSAAWAILEKRLPNESPGSAEKINQLLRDRLTPTLGGLTPNPGPASVVARWPDGGAILYLPAGVTLPSPPIANPADAEPPTIVAPAWVAVGPGRVAGLVPSALNAEMTPDNAIGVTAIGSDWFLANPARGPIHWLGNHVEPMVSPRLAAFCQVVGIDHRHRWLLRQPGKSQPTLVIDPTYADPIPRLPVWTMKFPGNPNAQQPGDFVPPGRVGWNAAGWPVIQKRMDDPACFALHADEWVTLTPAQASNDFFPGINQTPKSVFQNEPGAERALPVKMHALLTSMPATTQSAPPKFQPIEHFLWQQPDGTRYYGGRTSLLFNDAFDRQLTFPLDGPLAGSADYPTRLIVAGNNRLFLFNQPGRVVRFEPTPTAAQPLSVDATFTRGIPNVVHPTRIWLDPAGRIDIAFDDRNLAILFPSGHIPPAIAAKMPREQLDSDDAP